MLLSLSTLVVERSFSAKADGPGSDGVEGVVAPESNDGGLSVHILSLSLSDSSPLGVVLIVCRRGIVKELASGLWLRPSAALGGARRLGRRKRNNRGLNSSEAVVWDETKADEDGCRAKSEEDAGSDGRADIDGSLASDVLFCE